MSTFSFSCSHYLLREIRAAQVQNLPAFLASTSISSFELELYDVGLIPGGLIALGQFACPSITSFHLHLPEFQVSKSPYGFRDGFITEFLQALLMPRLEDLTISIDFQNVDIGEIECTQFLNNFLHALLPAYLTDDRARLSSLNYEIKTRHKLERPFRAVPNYFHHPAQQDPDGHHFDGDHFHSNNIPRAKAETTSLEVANRAAFGRYDSVRART